MYDTEHGLILTHKHAVAAQLAMQQAHTEINTKAARCDCEMGGACKGTKCAQYHFDSQVAGRGYWHCVVALQRDQQERAQ